MDTHAPDRTIPVPPDFPVAFDDPADAQGFWERELMHAPGQSTALEFDFQRQLIEYGMNDAFAGFELPVRGAYRLFNTYVYQAIAPVTHDPAELEALGLRAQEHIGRAIDGLRDRWEREQLPEVRAAIDRWERMGLGADGPALAGLLDETVALFRRMWAIHFRVAIPLLLGMSLFDDFYRGVFPGADRFAAVRLLQGQDNLSLRSDRALYALGRSVAASPALGAALAAGDARAVLRALEATAEGRAFRADLDAYLAEWGRRHDGFVSWAKPTWVEDPSAALQAIRDYAAGPEQDPAAGTAKLAAEREQLVADARERLAGMPESVRGEFELLLRAGQDGTVLQEDHNFWIDMAVGYELRRVLLAVGDRLAALGAIDARDDVWHLTVDEARGALAGGSDLRAAVAARRAELQRFAAVQPPPALGTFPPGPPPEDAVTSAIFKMFGGIPAEPSAANEVTGMAGSPGTVTGRARVLSSLAEAHRLEPGDVLVTSSTSPPWTPLFAVASAVVTDTGGILCHCAVVAREYGIPAVVGARGATGRIPDGAEVEVDGDAGVVRVLG